MTLTALLLVLDEDNGGKAITRARARIDKMLSTRTVAARHRHDLAVKRARTKRAAELGITYEELTAQLLAEARRISDEARARAAAPDKAS